MKRWYAFYNERVAIRQQPVDEFGVALVSKTSDKQDVTIRQQLADELGAAIRQRVIDEKGQWVVGLLVDTPNDKWIRKDYIRCKIISIFAP